MLKNLIPDVGDIRTFVLCPCVSRLAQGAVVRHRVQTPLQTSPRLVPTYQGCQPGHRLHRGNTPTLVQTPSIFSAALKHFHSCSSSHYCPVNGNRWSCVSLGLESRCGRVDAIISSAWFECTCCRAVITRWNVSMIVPGIKKCLRGKRWKWRGDWKTIELLFFFTPTVETDETTVPPRNVSALDLFFSEAYIFYF